GPQALIPLHYDVPKLPPGRAAVSRDLAPGGLVCQLVRHDIEYPMPGGAGHDALRVILVAFGDRARPVVVEADGALRVPRRKHHRLAGLDLRRDGPRDLSPGLRLRRVKVQE